MKRIRRLVGRVVVGLASVLVVAAASGQEAIPDFYRDPGLYPNRSYVNQSFNEHIDPFTGALQHHYVDIHLPGNGGFDLKVVRSYNSASVDPVNPSAFDSLSGLGWTIHFGRVLKPQSTAVCFNGQVSVRYNPVLELPDGSRQIFAFTDSGSPLLLSTQRWKAECITGGTGGLAVYSPDGTRYDMTQLVNVGTGPQALYAWYTTKITDRNGNYATIGYAGTASPQIASVSTSDGRSLTFSYLDSGLLSRRISSITASGGQTFNYGYQAISEVPSKYFLTRVTRPGGTTWEYSYNGPLGTAAGSYVMSRAKYPEGGTINYGYGWAIFDAQANPTFRSTVVASKSVSTGGSWSFAYSPGGFGAYDTTTVNTPAGTVTYKHVGPNYSSSGTVWMVGLLMSKSTGSTQTETYSWGWQQISSQSYFRPGQFVTKVDTKTYAPVLTQRQIVRDGATYTTSYGSFDGYGNPGTVTETGTSGGSRTTSLTYNINISKWIIRQVKDESFSGSSTTRSFDGNGNLLAVSRDGVATSYTYDGAGNVVTATFPRSLTHTFSSYKRGIPQTELQPEGINISRLVSDAGNVTSETNGEGRTTSYGYDALNRVTSIGYPTGNAVSISYGTASKSATRGSLTESTNYDGFGRPTSVTLGGVTRSYSWDALGRRTFESNPGSSLGTSYQYDVLGRITRVTNADGTARYLSYGAGTMTATDERSKSTTTSYRAYGDPDRQFVMSVQAPEPSANISIARNARDLVTSVSQGGVTRSYGYNGNYYLTSVVNPETGTTTYGRDAAGNMTSRSVGSSGTTTYGYDSQNRLTSVTYPGPTPSVSKTYSRTHKLKSATSSTATRTYNYDSNDNLTSESLSVDGNTFNIGYGYTSNDQLSSVTYPRSGRTVTYAPDVLGRPTQVSGYVTAVSYWPSGQIAQITYANGTVTTYQQNSRLWPSTFSVQKGSTVYANTAYGYDGTGNLTAIADAADSSYNRTLGYDGINRLTSASGPWGSGSIAYSGVGNITSQTFDGATLTYSYDGSNRLSTVTGLITNSYSYDAYGNIVTTGSITYTYDGAPNLRCVNCANSAAKIEYGYDGLNQRVVTTKAGVKTYEVYGANGSLLVEHTPSQGDKLIEYIHLGGKRIAQRQTSTGPGASTTTLSATPNPAAVNQSVTLTATVTGTNPTGTVTFKEGATTLGSAAVSAGTATLTRTFATAGSRSLSASYSGDAGNVASTSTAVSLAVNAQSASSTTLAVSPNPALVNQSVTLTATVTGTNPTGTVTFKEGATTLGSAAVSAGKATLTRTYTTAGSRALSASYSGDAGNAASTSTAVSLAVNAQTASSTTLAVSPNPAVVNQQVTLTATVTGNNPSGTVTFKEGTTTLGTATISAGTATLTRTFATAGSRALTASYGGDTGNSASTSTAVNLNVNVQAATSTTWTRAPAATSLVGTHQVLEVKVAPAAGGNSLPCDSTLGCSVTSYGKVRFLDGSTVLGEAQVGLTSPGPGFYYSASLTWVPSTAGSRTITAQYLGTVPNAPSQVTATANVTGSPPTVSASFSPTTVTWGQTYTFSWNSTNATAIGASCTYASRPGGPWSGSFAVPGGSSSGTPDWNGLATCIVTATGPGGSASTTAQITAVCPAGTSWTGATCATPPPTITVTRTPFPMVAGDAFTVTWSTTNATSVSWVCTSSGTGFSGSGTVAGVNGSSTALASLAWPGYPSTCVWTATGAGGTATFTETLTTEVGGLKPPPPPETARAWSDEGTSGFLSVKVEADVFGVSAFITSAPSALSWGADSQDAESRAVKIPPCGNVRDNGFALSRSPSVSVAPARDCRSISRQFRRAPEVATATESAKLNSGRHIMSRDAALARTGARAAGLFGRCLWSSRCESGVQA